ncbi:MAG: family 78 glycoside hydrolase catalytic domain, partial [Bacteroidales bacterium]|nr:family 78 glycoside hydrolase catalytic domain [Bacteroidales bacterium]
MPLGELKASKLPIVKSVKKFKPKSVKKLPNGKWMIDAGITLAGWAAINLKGKAGDSLTIYYGEHLHKDGSLDNTNLSVKIIGTNQQDVYICKGDGNDMYEPHFMYHGFQYIELNNYNETLSIDDVEIHQVRTSFDSIGKFKCSNETLNWIQESNRQSFESNFHGYPTDCPQREKNGWTGDAHLAAETGLYNYKMAMPYTKWTHDIIDAQKPNGRLPGIVPTAGWGYQIHYNIKDPMGPSWNASIVLVPWYVYTYRGDTRILEENYSAMKKYLHFIDSMSVGYISSFGIGDWEAPKSQTHWEITSTAYFSTLAETMSKIARILGKMEEH